jgi:hypothetical protein
MAVRKGLGPSQPTVGDVGLFIRACQWWKPWRHRPSFRAHFKRQNIGGRLGLFGVPYSCIQGFSILPTWFTGMSRAKDEDSDNLACVDFVSSIKSFSSN